MVKVWPKRTVTVGEGYGWEIVYYDPSVADLQAIREAREAEDEAKLRATLAGLVVSWEVCDRAGNPLPVEAESFDKVPPVVLSSLVGDLLQPRESDPKNGTGSLPTSMPDTGASR